MNIAKPYRGDNNFRARVRSHQSEFREKILGVDFDPNDKRALYGNLLPKEEAKSGLIFYDGYKDHIMEVAERRYGKINGTALYANLLRSEHIPLNIFTPMELNLGKTKGLFNEIIGGNIEHIISIRIEYAGKDNPINYLKDKTSFDTFINYKTVDGVNGGIGIEVKYTELGYKIGKKESDVIDDQTHPYTTVTKACDYFLDPEPKKFREDHLRQIWRNHILGALMVIKGDIEIFHCIHLYPEGNIHFHSYSIPEYQKLLTEKGRKSFIGLTYENLFHLMEKYFTNPSESRWVKYLTERYLF